VQSKFIHQKPNVTLLILMTYSQEDSGRKGIPRCSRSAIIEFEKLAN
jgi:hypothetical protein